MNELLVDKFECSINTTIHIVSFIIIVGDVGWDILYGIWITGMTAELFFIGKLVYSARWVGQK